MQQTRTGRDEVARRAEKLYAEQIRAKVETNENIGKMVIIDVDTGDYEVDPAGLESARTLQARHAGAQLFGIRIGYRAADAIGGAMERVGQ